MSHSTRSPRSMMDDPEGHSHDATSTPKVTEFEMSDNESRIKGTTQKEEMPRRKRQGSRRTKVGRMAVTEVPPREPRTDAEIAMLQNLAELRDTSGGLKSADDILSVVMIMKEDKRPWIHDGLLEILLKTTDKILERLLKLNQFLPVLYNWLLLYAKTETWNEIVINILKLFGKLPITKEDAREVRIKIKRLGQSGKTEEIRSAAKDLVDTWDLKRATPVAVGQEKKKPALMMRSNSWSKRKIGKPRIGADLEARHRMMKIPRSQFGPLSASHVIRRSATPSSPSSDFRQPFSSERLLNVDSLPPEASHAVNRLRLEKRMKIMEAPSQLVHCSNPAPSDSVFYAQQRALYDELRREKERQSFAHWEKRDEMTQAEISWTSPSSVQLPPQDIIRIPLCSAEEELQTKREIAVPSSDSGVLFSAALDTHHPPARSLPVFTIPFFPQNEAQYEQQRRAMLAAGVALPSVLGSSSRDGMQPSSVDPLYPPSHLRA